MKMVRINPNSDEMFMIGYGSFLTNQTYFQAKTVFVCRLKGYRRLWMGNTIFPFILPDPSFSGIHALCFSLAKDRLTALDKYEGVSAGLYTREEIIVELLNGDTCVAYIYIPTQKCIQEYGLTVNNDPEDSWLGEIRKIHAVGLKYPELLIHIKEK